HYVQYNSSSLSKGNDQKKLNEILQNATGILDFLSDKKISGLDNEINILKLAAKQTLLFTLQKEAFIRWKNIFPEANSYIWSFTALPVHLRFLGWCADHNIWSVIYIWIYSKRIKNKVTENRN